MSLLTRPLTVKDIDQVKICDDTSGFYVEPWLEDNIDFAWGIFNGDELIGYCTIGYAEDCCEIIEKYPGWTYDSLYLSDVFIKPEMRSNGYGLRMLEEAIEKRTKAEKELVFLQASSKELEYFYERAGFQSVSGLVMVKDERNSLSKHFG